MALTVIGAGFGRTGTRSLKLALDRLGFGPCHHMEEVLTRPEQIDRWESVATAGRVDWESVLAGYRSAVDWPSAHYWRELSDAYPAAKVILSVRPEERWQASFTATIGMLIENRRTATDAHHRRVLDFANRIIGEETFGGAMGDRNVLLSAYRRRIDDAKEHLAPERLLVFDVTQGWAPLCEYLGVPVPESVFPHGNSVEEFWSSFGGSVERS